MKRLELILPGMFALIFAFAPEVYSQSAWKMKPVPIETRWAKDVSSATALPEYPRPGMVRSNWQNLNGVWDYAITAKDAAKPRSFEGQILVPYPIESGLSGAEKALLPTQRLWYRRIVARPSATKDDRVLLHFGAVDWQATVYLNDKEVGRHQGGYQNFSFDITEALKPGDNELVVAVYDPTDQGPNPHGKQVLIPGGTWYAASSGIWQTVWLETVPTVSIASLELTPDVDAGVLRVAVKASESANGYTVKISAKADGQNVGSTKGKPGEKLQMAIPNAHLWSPSDPFLYDLSVELLHKGKVVDKVSSYFGMRKIQVKKDEQGVDRIFLNGKYTYNLGVLDQGFWPDGLYTAPTDAALRFDVEVIKAMGFNTIRKHIKVEPDRWYYWCDKLGMLVWQDMPQPANGTAEAKAEFETESAGNIRQLHNHPSIVAWVLFNEGWGAYDQERLAKWMKQLDPSRLLDGHTGGYINSPQGDDSPKWVASDMTDIHAYPGPGMPPLESGKARVLGEYGGIGVLVSGHQWDDMNGWGYVKTSPAEMVTRYQAMTAEVKKLEAQGLSASIYTQPFDVETEINGLLTYDRTTLKIPLARLREFNRSLVPEVNRLAATESAIIALPVVDTDPTHEYEGLVAQYNQGRRDLAFLRRASLLAHSLQQDEMARKMANDYISQMSGEQLYTTRNLRFSRAFTYSSTNPGFAFFQNNVAKIDEVMGKNYAEDLITFITAKERYEQGDRGLSLLRRLTAMALNNDDTSLVQQVGRDFGKAVAEEGHLTKTDVRILSVVTRSSDDKAFDLFRRDGAKIDEIMDTSGYAQHIVDGIITIEEVNPVMFPHGKLATSEPDWDSITDVITKKYKATYAERIVLGAKANWHHSIRNWTEFTKLLNEKLEKYPPHPLDGLDGDPWVLNVAAWDVFIHCSDKSVLTSALAWSDTSLVLDEELAKKQSRDINVQLVDTKSNLLYKLGRVQEGIALEEKAAELDTAQAKKMGREGFVSEFSSTVARMKQGEPTWPNN